MKTHHIKKTDAQAVYTARSAALKHGPKLAAPMCITNSSTKGCYKGLPDGFAARVGAEDFLQMPSRIGNDLHYRDGSTRWTSHGCDQSMEVV